MTNPERPDPDQRVTTWYTAEAAPDDLDEVLMTVWHGQAGGYREALPDGCPGIAWIEPGELWFCSPATTTARFWRPPGRRIVGISFRPGTIGRVLGADVLAETSHRAFHPLADIIDETTLDHIRAVVEAASDPLNGLTEAIRPIAAVAPPPSRDEELLTAALTASYVPPIAELARDLAMSARHLHRIGVAMYGFAPTTLARIIRLQRFLRVGRARPGASIAELAAEAGYYDHPHLCREARAIALLSPSEVLERFESTLPDHDDPYTPPSRRRA